VDRFGTLVSNIRREQLAKLSCPEGTPEVWVNGTALGPVRATYGDVSVGEPLALIGGADLLEIAVNQGRAVDRFGPPERVRIYVQ
jgi:S-adenosylmethionine hydrolase